MKTQKVYEVTFASLEKFGDCPNMSKETVLGATAEEAIISAKNYLNKKQKKTYYVEEVCKITTLS